MGSRTPVGAAPEEPRPVRSASDCWRAKAVFRSIVVSGHGRSGRVGKCGRRWGSLLARPPAEAVAGGASRQFLRFLFGFDTREQERVVTGSGQLDRLPLGLLAD